MLRGGGFHSPVKAQEPVPSRARNGELTMKPPIVPKDFPVQPLKPGDQAKDKMTCNACGLSWDDALSTSWTPTPGGRCPFEYFHREEKTLPLKVYARRLRAEDNQRGIDVTVYRDNGTPFVKFEWWRKSKPRKGQRYVMLNCYRWEIVWLPGGV